MANKMNKPFWRKDPKTGRLHIAWTDQEVLCGLKLDSTHGVYLVDTLKNILYSAFVSCGHCWSVVNDPARMDEIEKVYPDMYEPPELPSEEELAEMLGED